MVLMRRLMTTLKGMWYKNGISLSPFFMSPSPLCQLSKRLDYVLYFVLYCDAFRALRKLVNDQQTNWDTFLDATLFSLRSKVHTTTKHSPFRLMYEREAHFPSEVPATLPVSFHNTVTNMELNVAVILCLTCNLKYFFK